MREKLLLSIAALIAFGGCLVAPFQYDDYALFSDPAITSPGGWLDCWRLTQTRPLTWLTFWPNFQLGGTSAWGYHAVNLALHLIAVLLAYDVLRRLLPYRTAFAAAAIFAIHPMATEPVAYIFARGTLIAAVFSLLAVRSWIDGRPWHAAAWFAVAMTGKEECAALPLALALLPGGIKYRKAWAAMLAAALAFGLRAMWAAATIPGSGAGAHAGITPLTYLASQGIAILRYLRLIVIPWGFTVDTAIAVPVCWIATLAWAAVVAVTALLFLRKWGNKIGAGCWFGAGILLLLPSSSIFPASDLAADRRMYLPMVAFGACIAVIGARIVERADRRGIAAFVRVAIAAGMVVLGAISIRYTSLWRSPQALWREAILRAPEKTRPRVQLSRALPPERALEVLAGAARIAPDDPSIASEQGRVLIAIGHPEAALAAFGKALALDPENPAAMNNRGAALLALGQKDAARADFERALARDGCLFDAHLNLLRLGVNVQAPAGCRYTPRQKAMLAEAH